MASEAVLDPSLAPVEPAPSLLRRWSVRLAKALVVLLAGLLLGFAALIAFLDTDAGHRFIVDRIAAMTPASGLRVRIGRIDGSIWGRTQLKDVRLYDPDGLFAESPEIAMDWRPIDFLFDSLVINELTSDLVILHRLPQLIPSREPRPLLPDYDVHLGRLDVRQLRIGPRVSGRERVGRLGGQATIRSGRALLGLDIVVRDGGDRMRIRFEAEPDRDRFDLDARVEAPANSFVGALLGTRRPVRLGIDGEGSWTRWSGRALLDISARRTADLRLGMNAGRFRLDGWAAPAPFLRGKLQRLTAPRVRVQGSGLFADRRVDGRLSAASPSIRVEARGIVDLAGGRYRDVALAAELIRPPAMFRNMTGRQVRLAALLDGRFGTARFVYRL
ncbi:MAG TPA: translocation/assembly module TamB, partial [Allosphingosinicella sp.]|nr:translocation/assembly module TamB [Allosphingosinicella sp.]